MSLITQRLLLSMTDLPRFRCSVYPLLDAGGGEMLIMNVYIAYLTVLHSGHKEVPDLLC